LVVHLVLFDFLKSNDIFSPDYSITLYLPYTT
jgi:hypothetical protein